MTDSTASLRTFGSFEALGFALGVLVLLGGCASDDCTELGCDNEATVTYPAGFVDGPYDLVLEGEFGSLQARCNDPTSPEAADNPPEVECDAASFRLVGHDLANARTLRVTIIDDVGNELAAGREVILNVVEESQPNGEGCPPICFVRTGRLLG